MNDGAIPIRLENDVTSVQFRFIPDATIRQWTDKEDIYEPEVTDFFLRALRPGDVAVDVGANCGWFTCLAAALVAKQGFVYSFEPGLNVLPQLERNLDINGFDQIRLIRRPVADTVREIEFHQCADDSGGNALWNPGLWDGNDRSKRIKDRLLMRSTTLDDELGAEKRPIRLMKIDTEGAESLILEGAEQTLSMHPPDYIIAELHPFGLEQLGSTQQKLRSLMFLYGYHTWLISGRSIPMLVPSGTEINSQVILNLLFARIEKVAEMYPQVNVFMVKK